MQFQQLEHRLNQEKANKAMLQAEIEISQIKLDRAKTLLFGLEDEKERWIFLQEDMNTKISTIVADMLLSAAFIAYLGPLTSEYRKLAQQSWIFHMQSELLNTLQPYSLEAALGEPE